MPPLDQTSSSSGASDSARDADRAFERAVAHARRAESRRVALIWAWAGVTALFLVGLLLYQDYQKNQIEARSQSELVRFQAAAESERRATDLQIHAARTRAESALAQSTVQQTVIQSLSTRLEGRFADRDSVRHLRQQRSRDSSEVAALRATVSTLAEANRQREQIVAGLQQNLSTVQTRLRAVTDTVRLQQSQIAAARRATDQMARNLSVFGGRLAAKADTHSVNVLNRQVRVLQDSLGRIRTVPSTGLSKNLTPVRPPPQR